jgi:hypothetical protein
MLVHFEHGDAVLAEDGAKLVVGDDLALVLGILQVVLLDMVPDLIWSQTLLTTWLRGNASEPVIAESSFDGVTGRCKPLCLPCAITCLPVNCGFDRAQIGRLGNGCAALKKAFFDGLTGFSVD